MREKLFERFAQAEAFCADHRRRGFECDVITETVRRRRVITRVETVSYLRRVPLYKRRGKWVYHKRRQRVTFERRIREIRTTRRKVYRVKFFKPDVWQSLPAVIRRIQERYDIPPKRVTYPNKFLKWFHRPVQLVRPPG